MEVLDFYNSDPKTTHKLTVTDDVYRKAMSGELKPKDILSTAADEAARGSSDVGHFERTFGLKPGVTGDPKAKDVIRPYDPEDIPDMSYYQPSKDALERMISAFSLRNVKSVFSSLSGSQSDRPNAILLDGAPIRIEDAPATEALVNMIKSRDLTAAERKAAETDPNMKAAIRIVGKGR